MKLRDYQKRMVEQILSKKNLILSVGMGLGKTAAVLHAISEAKPRHVVIVGTKRIAETVWLQEAKDWNLSDVCEKMTIISGTTKQKTAAANDAEKPYKIVSRDNLSYLLDVYEKKAAPGLWLILDELTSFKNITSKRAMQVIQFDAVKMVGLTGTFAANGSIDFFGQAAAVGLEKVTFKAYRKKAFCPEFAAWRGCYFVNQLAGTALKFQKWKPKFSMSEMIKKYKDNIFTLDSNDYSDVPSISYFTHSIALTDELYDNYNRLATMLSVDLTDEVISLKEGAEFAKRQTLACGFVYDSEGVSHRSKTSPKLEAVADFCENAVSENEHVLLLYAYRDEAIWIAEMLKERGISFCSVKDKNFLEKWNTGSVDVLIGHPASIGHGLNLQYGGHIQVWSSITYNYEFWAQANARLTRPGQTKPVQIHVFQAKNTVEEQQYKAVLNKNKTNQSFIDLTK